MSAHHRYYLEITAPNEYCFKHFQGTFNDAISKLLQFTQGRFEFEFTTLDQLYGFLHQRFGINAFVTTSFDEAVVFIKSNQTFENDMQRTSAVQKFLDTCKNDSSTFLKDALSEDGCSLEEIEYFIKNGAKLVDGVTWANNYEQEYGVDLLSIDFVGELYGISYHEFDGCPYVLIYPR